MRGTRSVLRNTRNDALMMNTTGRKSPTFDHVKSKLGIRSNSINTGKMAEEYAKRARTRIEMAEGEALMNGH